MRIKKSTIHTSFASGNVWWILAGVLVTAYAIAKALHGGNDINVYMFAGGQIMAGENIYEGNLYNFYLYSPLFAILMAPLSWIGLEGGRVIWALFNLVLTVRLWQIVAGIAGAERLLGAKGSTVWKWGIAILSFGFLNHNLILGQVTVLILWLTLEGLYQIVIKDRHLLGGALIALGINIKIIPLIAIGYLFLKGRFKSLVWIGVFFGFFLILPSLIIGHGYNMMLIGEWAQVINPSGEKFAFENNNGCQSLNAVLPAYFYDYGGLEDRPDGVPGRTIASLSYAQLEWILNGLRVILLLSVALVSGFLTNRGSVDRLRFFRETGYLMLVSMLVFPHQMKYSMLYMVPAGGYALMWVLMVLHSRGRASVMERAFAIFALGILLLLSVMGRDIIGNYLVEILDYYHFMGLSLLVFIGYLLYLRPEKLQAYAFSNSENNDVQ